MQQTRFDVTSAAQNIIVHVLLDFRSIVLTFYAVEDLLALYEGRPGSNHPS